MTYLVRCNKSLSFGHIITDLELLRVLVSFDVNIDIDTQITENNVKTF